MTWNVWWRFGPRWAERQPLLLDTIRQVDADVVALQESWADGEQTQAGVLAEALGCFSAFARPSLPPLPEAPEHPGQVGVEIGVGVISRWPILTARVVPMPCRHRSEAPVTLIVTLAHPDGPLPVLVTCIEWEPAYNDDRMAQATFLAELATDPALDGAAPVVVVGDLNAAPGSPVLRPLLDVLTDAWAEGGGDPAAPSLRSDHPFAPVEAEELIDQRIDHVLYRAGSPRIRVESCAARLAGDAVDGLDPSDHTAVVCDLTWAARE